MISVCLTKFTNDPWSKIIMKGFYKALSKEKNICKVEEIFGYPQKKYDVIILVGIRSIVKKQLDAKKIIPFCRKLIDMGDSAMDPRKNFEDIYLYFNPSNKKLFNHYHYIPKFILEDFLYPEPNKEDKLNIYIDHFKCQNPSEREQSIEVIEKIFLDVRKSIVPLNVFYHTSKGIELNRLYPEIPPKNKSQCAAFVPFEEITHYYRQTDVFFPTHRETQGMVAQEIASCGGITVLQEWMYPKSTQYQFPNMLYNQNQDIDFSFIQETLKKNSKDNIRKHTLNHCGFKVFQDTIIDIIKKLF